MQCLRPPAGLVLGCAVLAAVLVGCSREDPVDAVSNIPPETILSHSPVVGDTVTYMVRMNWFGWDPDGVVTHFLAQWDSLDWELTTATDSVFAVPAEDTSPDSTHSLGYHTFSIKAVDDDGDGYVAGYGYRLMFRQGYNDYVEVASAHGLGPTETRADFGPLCGEHRFEVWAFDDMGARDRTPAVRNFSSTCWGPEGLRVTSNVFWGASRWQPYPYGYERPPVPVFDGEFITFDWSAEGQGLKYRCAYDDLGAWSDWSAANTHFEVEAEPGLHEMHVAVRDTLDIEVHIHFLFEAIEASLDDCIMIVDDYDAHEYHPLWGTDEDRDLFYDGIVAPFGDRFHWDPDEHIVNGDPQGPGVADLAAASTVIWYCDFSETEIQVHFDPFRNPYSSLGGYVRAGGNLVLCGWKAAEQIAGTPYPIDTADADSPGEVFLRDVAHIEWIDNSGSAANPNQPWDYGYCLHGAVPTSEGEALGFEPAYIDSGDCDGEIGKWFVFCDSPNPNYDRCGLNVEKMTPYAGESLELYTIDSFLNPEYEGETCALLYLSGDDRGNVCYFGFPLYYLQTDQAEAMLGRVLTLFGE